MDKKVITVRVLKIEDPASFIFLGEVLNSRGLVDHFPMRNGENQKLRIQLTNQPEIIEDQMYFVEIKDVNKNVKNKAPLITGVGQLAVPM